MITPKLLACSICLSFILVGCGAPRPATIKESGLKPVNDLKYYPTLTDSERRKFAKTQPKAVSSERTQKTMGQTTTHNFK